MALGKIIYPSGGGGTTYTFAKNYDFGHKIGYVDNDSMERALDGSLQGYLRPRKKAYELTFSNVTKAQFDVFRGLWDVQSDMDLYLDGTTKDATVMIVESPEGESQEAFVSGSYMYSFTLKLEEV